MPNRKTADNRNPMDYLKPDDIVTGKAGSLPHGYLPNDDQP